MSLLLSNNLIKWAQSFDITRIEDIIDRKDSENVNIEKYSETEKDQISAKSNEESAKENKDSDKVYLVESNEGISQGKIQRLENIRIKQR